MSFEIYTSFSFLFIMVIPHTSFLIYCGYIHMLFFCFDLLWLHPFLFCFGGWGLGGFSKVVATFNQMGGSFNLFMATTRGVWIIPPFQIWGDVLYVTHISCVITNCGQHQWAILSLFSIALEALLDENISRKLLLLSLDLFFIILLFQVTYILFYRYFLSLRLQVGLLLQYVALFQLGN